jgi:hypothetical protein
MIRTLGIDLGKNLCSVAGLDASGAIVVRAGLRKAPRFVAPHFETLLNLKCRIKNAPAAARIRRRERARSYPTAVNATKPLFPRRPVCPFLS